VGQSAPSFAETFVFSLEGTPYLLNAAATQAVRARLQSIEERVALLRGKGMLTEKTVRDYYGEKRFEQVAESNAIEGSTLSVGETELAILKGITITGHDPAYAKDAMALDRALTRITELARDTQHPTNIDQLQEVHALLLGDRPGAGVFRRERVSIRGARHTPPKTWEQIMSAMAQWQAWSIENQTLPAPIRSAVLHAWLTHIHPYIDGNGRVSRAIGNLELIRAGYPPIIIKKKERDRYIESLAESDEGGDIRSFLELVFDRVEGSLTGLELSAKRRQGFDPAIERFRQMQQKQLHIWETGVKLLGSTIGLRLTQLLEPVNGAATVRLYDSPLDLDDYLEVCGGRSVPRSWAFSVKLEIPGVPRLEKLAYISHRSSRMYHALNSEGGPSLFWSSRNPAQFPKWLADGESSPYAIELAAKAGNGDEWMARTAGDIVKRMQTTELADKIALALSQQLELKS
jgi:Fic family protein